MKMIARLRWCRDFARWLALYPKSSRWRVAKDYLSLSKSKGLLMAEYRDFEFEKQSPAFRDSFLGLNEQRYYLDYLNPKKYYILARNKYLAHRVLESVGIRMPELYCYYDPEGLYLQCEGVAGDLAAVHRIIRSKGVSSFVVKSPERSHGDSVFVVSHWEDLPDDLLFHLSDGVAKRLSDILGEYPLVFEEKVVQTAQMAVLNPSSVNTVRCMTALYPDGEAKLFAAFFKVGRAGKVVDNAGKGGNVDTCVDVESGEIKYAIQFDGCHSVKDIDVHPDSGARLNGMVIEGWSSLKEQVCGFQKAFPFIKVAGWDIAVTDNGPVVIEVNDFWDRIGQLFIRHGWREDVRDCYLAWKKTGKDYDMERQPNRLSRKELDYIVSRGR